MSVTSRLLEYIHSQGLTVHKLEVNLGLSKSRLTKIFNDNRPIASDLLEMIMEYFDMSNDELVKIFTGTNRGFASAGKGQIDTAKHYASEAEYVTESDIKKQIGQNHIVSRFKVIGDSMEPNLKNGDTLYCTDEPFKEYHVHVIECKDVTLVKRLKREHRNYYVAMSDNHAYGPIDIYDDEITNIWFAKAKLSYNLSGNREDLNTRLTHIEQVLSTLKTS